MGRNTTGKTKDDSITIKMPSEFKKRIKSLMVGRYQHFELQRFILYLIEQGMELEDAERDLKNIALQRLNKKGDIEYFTKESKKAEEEEIKE